MQNNSTGLDVNIVLRSTCATNGTQWKITTTQSGAFKLTPKTGIATDYVLATDSSETSSTVKLIQGDYILNDSYRDEWYVLAPSSSFSLEAQQQDSWCWAACARMASMRYMISPVSQASAAVYVMTGAQTASPTQSQINAANQYATVQQTEAALEHVLGSDNVYSALRQIYSEETLTDLLDDGNPVIILRGFYTDSGWRTHGHFVLIHDYYWDASIGMNRFEILDPLAVNVGSSYVRTYQSICNGRDSLFDVDFDLGVWEGIVVFENGDYDTTIDWPDP